MTTPRPLRAVVTAGGTEEAVDDVRTVSNVSSGRFGAAIARALERRGVSTTVLASRALAERGGELRGRIRVVPYRGFADLDRELAALEADPPDLVFMAAAVSDFSPRAASGKLPSDADTLDIHLHRNPKLLARLRSALGPRPVLVGFKLLSGVGPGVLERIAREQARGAGLDLTVANDLVDLVDDRHPVLLVPPEGEAVRVDAHREDTADAVVARALAILDARDVGSATAASARAPGGDASLERAVAALADRLGWSADERDLRVRGGERSMWLDTIGGVEALLAVDDAIGRFDATLTADEATSDETVRAALAEAARAGRWNGGPFVVGIEGGGAFLGLDARAVSRLDADFSAARAALAATGAVDEATLATARPVLDGASVGGVIARRGPRALVPFVVPAARGRGLGDALARALVAGDAPLAVAAASAEFFCERGFVRTDAAAAATTGAGALTLVSLSPPDLARAVPAASVALVDPLRRRVLLGRRLRAPHQGCWALPGGKRAPGESPRDAAGRELFEETGLVLAPELAPRLVTHVLAGDGARVFSIESLAFLVLRADAPTTSDELDAEWVSLSAALSLRPMTAGTRLVLARIEALLAGDS